jgi:hypothetical protein
LSARNSQPSRSRRTEKARKHRPSTARRARADGVSVAPRRPARTDRSGGATANPVSGGAGPAASLRESSREALCTPAIDRPHWRWPAACTSPHRPRCGSCPSVRQLARQPARLRTRCGSDGRQRYGVDC